MLGTFLLGSVGAILAIPLSIAAMEFLKIHAEGEQCSNAMEPKGQGA